jgi:hypothetical protein
MKTREELERYRVEIPEPMRVALAACEGCDYSIRHEEDEYGHYSTGLFHYKGKDILITIDEGMWHMSINSDHPLSYYELKELRYLFIADHRHMAQIFPPRSEFINLSENCFHLYELNPDI